VFSPKHRVKEFSECYLSFDGTIVTDASFVKNLGIFFDRTLFIQKQASVITKSCYFQIRNFGRIRSYTTEDTCKTLKETNAYKYLGVYFSRSLSFSYHINCYLKENFEKKSNFIMKLLGEHGSFNRISFGDALWKSIIRPSIVHGCAGWIPSSNASIASLESWQYKSPS
jgi:hypothetical protein